MSASAEASVERFRDEFDKLQRALKKSINTEKVLVTKVCVLPLAPRTTADTQPLCLVSLFQCRELKTELVDKSELFGRGWQP